VVSGAVHSDAQRCPTTSGASVRTAAARQPGKQIASAGDRVEARSQVGLPQTARAAICGDGKIGAVQTCRATCAERTAGEAVREPRIWRPARSRRLAGTDLAWQGLSELSSAGWRPEAAVGRRGRRAARDSCRRRAEVWVMCPG